jgi:hypothetical protein
MMFSVASPIENCILIWKSYMGIFFPSTEYRDVHKSMLERVRVVYLISS